MIIIITIAIVTLILTLIVLLILIIIFIIILIRVLILGDKSYDDECQEVIDILDTVIHIPSEYNIIDQATITMFLKLKESIINPKRNRTHTNTGGTHTNTGSYKEGGTHKTSSSSKIDSSASPRLVSIFSSIDFEKYRGASSEVTAFELFARSCGSHLVPIQPMFTNPQLLNFIIGHWNKLETSFRVSWGYHAHLINEFIQGVTDNGTIENFELEDILRDFCTSVGNHVVTIQGVFSGMKLVMPEKTSSVA